jgi:zinc-binding alcohol dehydrogenase family protein
VNDLKDKIEAGRFVPVIDRRYPLAAIADAYRYVRTGEKAGVVVIDIVAGRSACRARVKNKVATVCSALAP